MRTNKLHVVRFRGVCSVIELSEKKEASTSLPPAPCAVPTAWGLTKLKLLIAVGIILTALLPAEVVNLLSVVGRGRDRWRVAVVR